MCAECEQKPTWPPRLFQVYMNDFWIGFYVGIFCICLFIGIFAKDPKEPKYIIIKENQIVKDGI